MDRLQVANRAVWLLILLCIGACAFGKQPLPILSPASPDQASYRLHSGDLVRVDVFDVPALSGDFRLDETGALPLPLIGTLPAAGATAAELARTLSVRFRETYVKDPDVTVRVLEYRSVFVLGEVMLPGSYSYTPGMTVLNAVAVARGFSYRANRNAVVVTRQGKRYQANLSAVLLPGDTVEIGTRYF